MKSQLRVLIATICVLTIVTVLIFVCNQTAQVVQLANTLSPALGRALLVCLLGFYTAALLVPLVLFLRLPKALTQPESESGPAFQDYLKRVAARLERNPNLKGQCGKLANAEDVREALKTLDAQSNQMIQQRAAKVFLATAISQNGRLDAITVLIAQSSLVWQIAHYYNQRPTLRDMTHLYANVGAAVLLASELQDIDISEQLEPVVRTLVGASLLSYLPGAGALSAVLIHSVLEGASNAYLTLRVGVICQRYCGSLTAPQRTTAARSASAAAAVMLGAIVINSGTVIAQAIGALAKKTGVSAIGSAAERVKGVGAKLNPFT